jgi:hypothetical protein
MIDQIMLDSIEAVRSDIPEIHVTSDTDLNSKGFQENVTKLPIVILRKFLAHPDCSEISSHGGTSAFNSAYQQDSTSDRADFSMESLERMYGNQKIIILSQDVDVSGFKLDEKNMWEKMTLQSFILYVKGLHQLLSVTDSICVHKRTSLLDAALECMEVEPDQRRSAADAGLDSVPENTQKPNGIESASIEKEESVDQGNSGHDDNLAIKNKTEQSQLPRLPSETFCSKDSSLSPTSQKTEKDDLKFLQADGTRTAFFACNSAASAIKADHSSALLRNRRNVEGMISPSKTSDVREKEKTCRDVSRYASVDNLRSYLDGQKWDLADGTCRDKHIGRDLKVAYSPPCFTKHQNISTDNAPKTISTRTPSSRKRNVEHARCQLLSLLTIATCANDVEKDATLERFRRRRKKSNPSPLQAPDTSDRTSCPAGRAPVPVPNSDLSLMEGAYISWSGISATDFKKVNQEAVAADIKANDTVRPQTAAGSLKSVSKSAEHRSPDNSRSRSTIRNSVLVESSCPSILSPTPLSMCFALPSSTLQTPLYTDQKIKKGSTENTRSSHLNSEGEMDAESLLSVPDVCTYWFQDSGHSICHIAQELKGMDNGEEMKRVESKEKENGAEIREDFAEIRKHSKTVKMELAVEGKGDGLQQVVIDGGSSCEGAVCKGGLNDLNSLSVGQSEVDSSQLCGSHRRFERNKQYAIKCRQLRASNLSQETAPSFSSIAIGWKKGAKKRNSLHSDILSPVSVRKRKCTYSNLGGDASSVELLESTVVLREKLLRHKQIVKNLKSNAIVSSASRPILCGASCVIARLSVMDGVWSLDLTFLPFGMTGSTASTVFMGHSTPDRSQTASDRANRGGGRCILYSPLNSTAFLDLGPEDYEYSEGDMDLYLDRILDFWSPLCSGSGRQAGSSAEESCRSRNRVTGHQGIEESAAIQDMKGAVVCDGVAMQAELLRLLKISPYGVMALLADTATSNLSCNTPRIRGGDCAVRSNDAVPSSVGNRDRDRDPLGIFTNTTHQDLDRDQTPHSVSPALTLTDSATPSNSKLKQTLAQSPMAIAADTFLKPKKKLKASTLRDLVAQGPSKSSDDLQASKLEGVMRGRLKFCTNLDMSGWDRQMQVT